MFFFLRWIFLFLCLYGVWGGSLNISKERNRVLDLFDHGFSSYMKHAFPLDELCPLSCSGHDTLGNYSLTLIDTLDMLAIIGDIDSFEHHIRHLQANPLSFNLNVNVSSFETNIRIVGGLLSAHLFAEDLMDDYPAGMTSLLDMAVVVGDILLKAFDTPTGIPYGTVNMAQGGSVPPKETTVTSLATAGSFSIEFGILSSLTKNPIYQETANKAVEAVWKRRSKLDLLGNHIDIHSGDWKATISSTGGNSDSYYEYLLKNALLFGNREHERMFEVAYLAIMTHSYSDTWYPPVEMNTGKGNRNYFESLQGFWPGVQVLFGDVSLAANSMHSFHSVWRKYGFLPELYDFRKGKIVKGREQYPLRPEMAESLYFLYTATRDPIWLRYGKEMVDSIEKYAKVECGVAAVENVEKLELRDHMDSFFLSETCKYLFLLFTPNHFITRGSYIFNTEGHPFPIRSEWLHYKQATVGTCKAPLLVKNVFESKMERNEEVCLKEEQIITSVTYLLKGASLEVSYPHGDKEGTYTFSDFGSYSSPLVGTAKKANPFNACVPLEPHSLQTKIAFVRRGFCMFTEKVFHAQEAGAIAVIVVDNENQPQPVGMSGDDSRITIPSILIPFSDGETLLSLLEEELLIFRVSEAEVSPEIIINISDLNLDEKNVRDNIEEILSVLDIIIN